jgi:pilus assembly protein Flp/PilA
MAAFASRVRRFLVGEDGPTAVEYAVMLALIVLVCYSTVGSLGSTTTPPFSTVNSKLSVTTGGGH